MLQHECLQLKHTPSINLCNTYTFCVWYSLQNSLHLATCHKCKINGVCSTHATHICCFAIQQILPIYATRTHKTPNNTASQPFCYCCLWRKLFLAHFLLKVWKSSLQFPALIAARTYPVRILLPFRSCHKPTTPSPNTTTSNTANTNTSACQRQCNAVVKHSNALWNKEPDISRTIACLAIFGRFSTWLLSTTALHGNCLGLCAYICVCVCVSYTRKSIELLLHSA